MKKQNDWKYRRSLNIFSSLLFLFWFSLTATTWKKEVLIVKEGKPLVNIVIPGAATKELLFAAEELQHYIEKISGARLDIVSDRDIKQSNNIYIGKTADFAAFSKDRIEKEGFQIVTKEGSLFLLGADDIGTQFSVYSFLEEYLNVHWLWPGELGEVVPQKKTIKVPSINKMEQPCYKWRSRMLSEDGENKEEEMLWEKRNKWGGMKVYGGHSLSEVFPPEKYAKEHPEYYALVRGIRDVPGPDYDYKHGCQVCTTNPDVINIATEWANNFFDLHPDYDAVNMSMNDGGGLGYCQCDRCLALDDGRRIEKPLDSDESLSKDSMKNIVITDRIFTYINKIAENVQIKHPGKYIMCYAYSQYKRPPRNIVLNENVIPQYTQWSAYRHANEQLKEQHQKIVNGWMAAAKTMAIYEYYINGSWPSLPRIAVNFFAENIQSLYDHGVRLYYTQAGTDFATNGINYYVAGKLLWNSKASKQKIFNTYYKAGFGLASKDIRNYFDRLEKAWMEATRNGTDINAGTLTDSRLADLYTSSLLQSCSKDLDRAAAVAENNLIKKRVAFVRNGFHYTELTVKAVILAKQVLSMGVPLFVKDKGKQEVNYNGTNKVTYSNFTSEQLTIIRKALNAWQERDLFVEAHKKDFTLSYYWIKYNDRNRYFNPRSGLEKLVELLPTSSY